MPKYFFFDVDGTLLPFGKAMPESAERAIKAAEEAGNKCFIASGRSKAELPFLPVSFSGYVSSGGATVEIEGQTIYSEHIERNMFENIFDYLTKSGYYVIIQTEKATYLSEETAKRFESLLLKHIGRLLEISAFMLSDTVPADEDVKKLLFFSLEETGGIEKVREEIDAYFKVVDNTIGLPQGLMAEIVRSDITKATGIERVLSYYGASREDAVAVGDGSNDIEMVEYAATGIAMGNACSELKAAADYVTSDVESDGLQKAIQFALRGKEV